MTEVTTASQKQSQTRKGSRVRCSHATIDMLKPVIVHNRFLSLALRCVVAQATSDLVVHSSNHIRGVASATRKTPNSGSPLGHASHPHACASHHSDAVPMADG